ncbi:MAG TPA: hypothetical protein VLH10_25885, partial [Yinghuangia sp.]|nr:hypothetical protein [Yinghuangia sp.]
RGPETHGEGWTTVVEVPVDKGLFAADPGSGTDDADAAEADKRETDGIAGLLDKAGTRVTGPWGGGTLFTTRLATVLVTDDGRLFVGAVDGDTLQRVVTESAAGR